MDAISSTEKPLPTFGESVNEIIKKEGYRGFLPGLLWSIDMARWISHQPIPTGNGLPYLTDGVSGFIDQHLGNAFPTISLIYVARIPVEIGAKLYEAVTSNKLSARAKLYTAIAMGVTWPVLLELGIFSKGNTVDPLDHFGTLVATVAISAGFEFAEFMSKPASREMKDKFKSFGNSIEKTFGEVGEKMFPTTKT